MNEQQALAKMYSPGMKRPNKREPGGVIQIHITRACDKSCFNCTQGSQLRGPYPMMTPFQFEDACRSLKDYFGTVGVFGGNPATHPEFLTFCEIIKSIIPFERRGIWCNNPIKLENAQAMRETFNPRVSNLNVHLDQKAYDLFKAGWPESLPFGLHEDSRHSPPFVAMQDVLKKVCSRCNGRGFGLNDWCDRCKGTGQVYDEETAWQLISNCDINQNWSAMICVFRGELRGFFCEIAGAQAMLHQDDPDYPDLGVHIRIPWMYEYVPNSVPIGDPLKQVEYTAVDAWWKIEMSGFAEQVRFHCHGCGVPLRGHGELACTSDADGVEQVSKTHEFVYNPKRPTREVQLVTLRDQLGQPIDKVTNYLQRDSLKGESHER